MARLQLLVDQLIEDVNKEEGYASRFFDKMTSLLFSFIKWTGVPFVVYLLLEITKW